MRTFRRSARFLKSLHADRLPRVAWTLLVTLTSVCWAAADEPHDAAPFSRDLTAADSWDSQGAVVPASTQTETEASLAARVAELERIVREGKTTYASQETLPGGGDKAALPECKPVDIITKPTATVTGRIHFDGVVYDDDDATSAFFNKDRENEFGFRRMRIGVKGNIYENMIYTLEVDFRGTDTAFKDIYMEQQNIPVIGHVRAGHFKEPYSLEEDTSDNFVEFMERSTATTTFAPSRNFGVMFYNSLDECQDATWFTGVFRGDSPDVPNATGLWRDDRNDWCWTSRFAWLPFYDEPSNGRYLVHLGGSYSWRRTADVQGIQNVSDNQNGLAQFTPLSWVGSQAPIGIGAEGNSDEWSQFGAEFLVIWGALSVQSEFYDALLTSGENYSGAYATVSYFLTGESRGYHKEVKLVDKVTPFEPAFWVDTCHGGCCGLGAWELMAGWSYSNLRDGHDTTPGTAERAFIDTVNLGVNWYQNTWSRVQINYEHEMTNFVNAGTPDADANIFGMRWAIYW